MNEDIRKFITFENTLSYDQVVRRYPKIAEMYGVVDSNSPETLPVLEKHPNGSVKLKIKKRCIVCRGEIYSRRSKYCSKECSRKARKNNLKPMSIELAIRARYLSSDNKKKREFNLSPEWIKENIVKPCVYCGRKATGFDRIDNSVGHTEENCVSCCRECNSVRNNIFTHEEMKEIGKFLSDNIYTKRGG